MVVREAKIREVGAKAWVVRAQTKGPIARTANRRDNILTCDGKIRVLILRPKGKGFQPREIGFVARV